MKERKKNPVAVILAFLVGAAVTAGAMYGWMKATDRIVTDENEYNEYKATAEH